MSKPNEECDCPPAFLQDVELIGMWLGDTTISVSAGSLESSSSLVVSMNRRSFKGITNSSGKDSLSTVTPIVTLEPTARAPCRQSRVGTSVYGMWRCAKEQLRRGMWQIGRTDASLSSRPMTFRHWTRDSGSYWRVFEHRSHRRCPVPRHRQLAAFEQAAARDL